MTELTLYSMDGCASCVNAANLLTRNGIQFKTVKIDEDPEAWAFIRSKGHRSMPQIYDGDKLHVEGGYEGLVKHYK